ncbi:hypothetical protein Poli38472_011055 [Pythium oligandrum]|uniref:Yippee domain-containing protein n=1 Tax=Pythium oligandrum TaxID=41045 RepID=A0A8K1CQ27_PYTOL|nr:hypothetical protein Poli38472_011055 [Pythium oligandrum]|eukprot:TMW67435.1 hypothetical protein Poli38472_011055 [Pythium oligandrum]
MAPLVIMRRGCKQVEYRDRSHVWTKTLPLPLRSDEGASSDDDDGVDDDEEDVDDEREHLCDGHEDDDDSEPRDKTTSFYGLKTELYEFDGMRAFRCAECGSVVADRDEVIAKSFFGRTGKAYLLNSMFNVRTGSPRNRYLMTGMHTICDVHCKCCNATLGWKYLRAMELSQKYKEGKFIMERAVVDDAAEEATWKHL